MILHTIAASPNHRRVHAVISHLGLPVEFRHYDFFKGELKLPQYLALNANAKVPTLEHGDFVLWETTAIMQYLCEQVGNTDLFPRSPRLRADITRWQCWEGLYFNAALSTLAWETVVKPKRDLGPADEVLLAQGRATLDRFAPVLDAHMKGRKYLVDERLTVADYSMATFEPYIDKVPYDFTPFRHIRSYFERMRQAEHWVRAGQAAVAQSKAA
jgi:glutathione S-transferase